MTFRKFKKIINKYFNANPITKGDTVYFAGNCYLKCDNVIRFEIRYYRKSKNVVINPNSYVKTNTNIVVKGNIELAINKLIENVINEYKSWVKYWKDYKQPTQEEKEKFWEDK